MRIILISHLQLNKSQFSISKIEKPTNEILCPLQSSCAIDLDFRWYPYTSVSSAIELMDGMVDVSTLLQV